MEAMNAVTSCHPKATVERGAFRKADGATLASLGTMETEALTQGTVRPTTTGQQGARLIFQGSFQERNLESINLNLEDGGFRA